MKEKRITITEIRKALATLGIELFRVNATINGKQVYRIKGKGYNPCAIWTFSDLRLAYKYGQFWAVR